MQELKMFHRKKVLVIFLMCTIVFLFLVGRLTWLMLFQSEYYMGKAQNLHERERTIKAARGRIIDARGKVLATNRAVCTISVIHNQIEEPEEVIQFLCESLELSEETVRARVEKRSSIERIKTNVPKEIGNQIRVRNLAGVKVDEDYRRWYPYKTLASKVLGFTGADNQGIIGLEAVYEDVLKGMPGKIRTLTDARGVELSGTGEKRSEPVEGQDLYISLDMNIQTYAQQEAERVMEKKEAERVSILLMRPKTGEILAMVNVPEFDLNEPFVLNKNEQDKKLSEKERQEAVNQMWRNECINDTYEPGSTFKIITAAAAMEEGVVREEDTFFCPGYKMVEDRRIRCHKSGGHGAETFVQGAQNSCNPVFIEVGLRLGAERFYHYFEQFGLKKKTGIDLPGEASAIMHKMEAMGQVELATCAFGQSFQITPLQLATTVSALINGGKRVVPHFGVEVRDREGAIRNVFEYPVGERILSEENSKRLCMILEQVVDGGSGKHAYLPGYHIGGKTATSETLPRRSGNYIASFLGFAPANDPEILGLCVIHHPKGVYYGGTIAAPVIREIFANILPYLGIEQDLTQNF